MCNHTRRSARRFPAATRALRLPRVTRRVEGESYINLLNIWMCIRSDFVTLKVRPTAATPATATATPATPATPATETKTHLSSRLPLLLLLAWWSQSPSPAGVKSMPVDRLQCGATFFTGAAVHEQTKRGYPKFIYLYKFGRKAKSRDTLTTDRYTHKPTCPLNHVAREKCQHWQQNLNNLSTAHAFLLFQEFISTFLYIGGEKQDLPGGKRRKRFSP